MMMMIRITFFHFPTYRIKTGRFGVSAINICDISLTGVRLNGFSDIMKL